MVSGHRNALAAFLATAVQNFTATFGSHAGSKAVGPKTREIMGLKSTLRHRVTPAAVKSAADFKNKRERKA